MTDLENARAFFAGDRFATEAAGAVIQETGDGWARCSMVLTDIHRNALGAVMGGAVFTLADLAFAVAANWHGKPTVTLCSQVTFLSGAKGKTLFALCRRVKDGRSAVYYETEVTDDLGTLVAKVTTSGFVVQGRG